jgi:hypothetical protein
MPSPLVSCLVTAYNYERFLERAVESALAQDVASLEVVIVDDGSTDGTGAVADALAARHPDRVRVIHKANGGWISAMNAAIEAARGTYLGILDADDAWLPGKLRAQLALLEARPELGLVYSDLRLIDENDATLEQSFWAARDVDPFEGKAAAGLVTVGNCVATSTILVRASLKDAFFPLPAEIPYGDWWIGFRTATVAEIAPVREPLSGYRQHGKNLTLDVQGEALVRELRKEHLFRRIAIAGIEPGVLTVAESVRAYGALEASAHVVRSAAGTAFAHLPDPDPAAAEQELALAGASTPLAALRHRLRAVALDPWSDEARAAFIANAQELAGSPHAREEVPQAPVDEQEFLALGFLDELVDTPDMLTDYVHAFDGNPNARLVLLAPGQDPEELGTALEPIAQALGLDREDSAEVVVVTSEGAGEELAQKAAAVYTREYRNSYLTDVPQTGAIEELIRMAKQPDAVPVAAAAVEEPDVLAIGFLEEIAAAPELLEDFARTYDGRRDTRLVLLAPEFAGSEERLTKALETFARAMGLDRDESADVVVLTDPAAEAELAPRAHAVYSRVPRSGSLAGLPHVERAHELDALGRTPETVVAAPAPAPAVAERPIFIIGAPRSGTSMLSHALRRHPALWGAQESDFLGPLIRETLAAHAFGTRRGDLQWLSAQAVEPEELLRAVGVGINTLYSARSGGRRWIEQTPEYTLYAEALAEMFPDALFLFIVRDGREVAHSLRNFEANRKDLADGAKLWDRFMKAGTEFARTYPERVLRVDFAGWSEDPEAQLRAIYEFIGEPFEPASLEVVNDPNRLNSSFAYKPGERVGSRWQAWSPEERAAFAEHAGDMLVELGFETDRSWVGTDVA